MRTLFWDIALVLAVIIIFLTIVFAPVRADPGSCAALTAELKTLQDIAAREKLAAWLNREGCPKYNVTIECPLQGSK